MGGPAGKGRPLCNFFPEGGMEVKAIHIPRHIDDPQQLLLWSADEVMPIILGLLIGMIIGKALICTMIGFVVMHQYRKFRDNHPDGFLQHAAYEWGFMPSAAPSFGNPYIRQLFPIEIR